MPNESFIKTPLWTWERHKSKFQHKNCSTRKTRKTQEMSFFEATFKKYPRWVTASSIQRCSNLRHLTTWCRLSEHFRLYGLLLALLSNQRLVDVRDHTWEKTKQNKTKGWAINVSKSSRDVTVISCVDCLSHRKLKAQLRWSHVKWN